MQDQHKHIKGYRDLTQAEIDLMNEIKAKGEELDALIRRVEVHLTNQSAKARSRADCGDAEEHERLAKAGAYRWSAIARTDLQTGLMALTRAVAQPTTF